MTKLKQGGTDTERAGTDASGRFSLPLDVLLLLVLTVGNLWFNQSSSAWTVTLLAVYVTLSIFFPKMSDELSTPTKLDTILFNVRLFIILFVALAAVGLPTGMSILARHAQGPATNANDGMIQTEEAIKFILNGRNPYTENYLNTPLAEWKGGEPPWTPTEGTLYHNPYLPFLFIGSIPFYYLSNALLGWYDQRFLYLLLYIGLLLLIPLLVHGQRNKLAFLSAFGLNLLFAFFLADGRNDVVILFGLILTSILLAYRRTGLSALVLGLTLMIKHSAWFFLPFYFIYLMPRRLTIRAVRDVLLQVWPLFATTLVILLPFLLWDARSFFDDTVVYLVGGAADSYPIRGWGLSTLLLAIGIIPSPYSSFQFGILEILFGLPTLILFVNRQRRENTLCQVWLGFVAFSFVVEYFSRFFNDNYFVLALQALVIAAFIAPFRYGDEINGSIEVEKSENI